MANARANVFHIFRNVSNDLSLANSWPSLGVVLKGVVVLLSNSVELGGAINIIAEVNVVNLINIAFVHVASEDLLSDVLGGVNLEQVKDSQELELGNVAVLGAIKVLEARLEVHAADLDSPTVLIHNFSDLVITGSA